MFRRSQTPTEVPQQPEATDAQASSKGRPTPKRSDAEAARKQRLKAPQSRREAARQGREKARAQRVRARQALLNGDERYLPARDAGPVRRFARDHVDARRNAGELFIPGAAMVFILTLIPNAYAQSAGYGVYMVLVAAILVDAVIITLGMRKALKERFAGEPARGAIPYAVVRSLQLRRLRLPRPQVKPGRKS